jgi:hypothetical protein
VVPRVHKEAGLGHFYQIIIVLSQHGEHYKKGGGVLELDGERFAFEEYSQLGDIVIYNSRSIHGVEDIDPHEVYSPEQPRGRLAGFVTLYRDLRDLEVREGYLTADHSEDLSSGIDI